ncbi:MAG: pSer/pThr/pTyr-binding forkhead associated (FHA) protein [Planctomycetaceae bacterium]|jgi:pSer/pThr/pTyr-binding forkhead associated (FHA) protein
MPVLEIVGELGIERLLELSTSQTLIGRDRRKCQVVFDDSGVSRIHARIKTIGEQFILKDCDSRNGTTVNGRKIATGWPLADGDEVGIDRHRLLFRADDPHPLLDRPSSIGGVFRLNRQRTFDQAYEHRRSSKRSWRSRRASPDHSISIAF